MTSLQRPTTCPTYWPHATVCYTRYGSCAVMASQSLRCMISFVLPSSRSWPTTWSGACSAVDRAKLESFVSWCKRLEYCSSEPPTYSDLTDEADDTLFSRIMSDQPWWWWWEWVYKKLSCCRETTRRALSIAKCCTNIRSIAFKKSFNRRLTFKVIQG